MNLSDKSSMGGDSLPSALVDLRAAQRDWMMASRAAPEHEAAMREAPHPTPARLAGFVRGDLGREDNRAVVRHLLVGCQACSAALRPLLEQAR